MKDRFFNAVHLEGCLYSHSLERKISGPNSKNPNTEYITGSIDIATDDDFLNIVTVHYRYVTAMNKNGPNPNYAILAGIIDGKYGNVMANGPEGAEKVRVDSALGLNEFYSDQRGTEDLVSVKRNDGGFIHLIKEYSTGTNSRNNFDFDIVITNVREIEGDDEKGTPAKAVIKGAVFSYFKDLLPVELEVVTPSAMNYFLSLDASASNPIFTRVKGIQVSNTVKAQTVEEGAFGDPIVHVSEKTTRAYQVTWSKKEPYEWDDENSITANEFKEMLSKREISLATLKQNYLDRKNRKSVAAPYQPRVAVDFNF